MPQFYNIICVKIQLFHIRGITATETKHVYFIERYGNYDDDLNYLFFVCVCVRTKQSEVKNNLGTFLHISPSDRYFFPPYNIHIAQIRICSSFPFTII